MRSVVGTVGIRKGTEVEPWSWRIAPEAAHTQAKAERQVVDTGSTGAKAALTVIALFVGAMAAWTQRTQP